MPLSWPARPSRYAGTGRAPGRAEDARPSTEPALRSPGLQRTTVVDESALALQRRLHPRARKIDQCFFLFFIFGLVRPTESFFSVLPELVALGLRSAATTFLFRSISDQNCSVDCRNSSALDIDSSRARDALFDIFIAQEPAPIDRGILYNIAQSEWATHNQN